MQFKHFSDVKIILCRYSYNDKGASAISDKPRIPDSFRCFIGDFEREHLSKEFALFDASRFYHRISRIFSSSNRPSEVAETPRRKSSSSSSIQGNEPLNCSLCDQDFAYRSRLLEHLSSCHFRNELEKMMDPSNPTVCPECKTEKYNEYGNIVHLGAVHGKVLEVMPERLAKLVPSN